MRCLICKKSSDEVDLFEGITEDGMIIICDNCAEKERIPLIKKPSPEKLETVEKRPSVRERMERLSGYNDRTEISDEQASVQNNLARLKNPYHNQSHPDVEDNYYWEINMARRRKKMSVLQLSEKTGVEEESIKALEKGVLVEGFPEILTKLEHFLGVKLMKKHATKMTFHRTNSHNEEAKILAEVRRKMGQKEIKTEEDRLIEEIEHDHKIEQESNYTKKEKLRKISSGELDLSRRQNLDNVTLNDLITMKIDREKSNQMKRARLREEAMIGDDLDLDEI